MNTKNPPLLDFIFQKQIFKVKQCKDLFFLRVIFLRRHWEIVPRCPNSNHVAGLVFCVCVFFVKYFI